MRFGLIDAKGITANDCKSSPSCRPQQFSTFSGFGGDGKFCQNGRPHHSLTGDFAWQSSTMSDRGMWP